jgi:HNH endonuclease
MQPKNSGRLIERVCQQCGVTFGAQASEVRKGWARFCSRACCDVAKVGSKLDPDAFWARVIKTEMCWPRPFDLNADGYGRVSVGHPAHRVLAHRHAFELSFGPIPEGMDVCHRCDNPPCVRPDHLFLGSHADNLADMRAKDRQVRGERHGMVKMSTELAREAKRRLAAGEPRRQVADALGLTGSSVAHIANGESWTRFD